MFRWCQTTKQSVIDATWHHQFLTIKIYFMNYIMDMYHVLHWNKWLQIKIKIKWISQYLSSVQTLKSLKVIPLKSLRIHWWMSFSLNDRHGLLLQARDSWSSLWLKFREFRLCHNQNIFRLNPYILKRTNMVLTTTMDGQFIYKTTDYGHPVKAQI